ncbi:hypothetical protein WJX72_012501 [[Myrmecia] bisecta]|uniref:VTT domain-containing protein n=1 Tax=[Myrmecia] bisecta TaxID=41462 RepID=A0AAW1RAH9_9CHLO
MSDGVEQQVSQLSKLLALAFVVVALAVAVVAFTQGYSFSDAVAELERAITESGSLGPLIFVLAYAASAVLFFPASVLTLAAGYLFGPLTGTALVSVASTLGAALAFLVSRYVARPYMEAKLREYPKFQSVDRGIAARGPKVVLLLRLSPLVPFTLLNYMLGLTRVDFWPYVGASWAGMLPATFAYVYLGGAGRAAQDASGAAGFDTTKLVLYGVGAVATLWASKIISNVASDALNEDTEQ